MRNLFHDAFNYVCGFFLYCNSINFNFLCFAVCLTFRNVKEMATKFNFYSILLVITSLNNSLCVYIYIYIYKSRHAITKYIGKGSFPIFRLLRNVTKFWWILQFFMLNPIVFFFREMKNKNLQLFKVIFFHLFVKESKLVFFFSIFSCFIIEKSLKLT